MTSPFVPATDFVLRCLEHASPSRFLAVTIDAPRALPEAFLASASQPYGTLWSPAQGASFATSGAAARVVLDGADRYNQLRREAGRIFDNMDVHAETSVAPPTPRLFGGLAFTPGASAEPPWTEFGDGAFVLPRWTYAVSADHASLTLIVGPDQPRGRAEIAEELDAIVAGIAGTSVSMWAPTIPTLSVNQLPFEAWAQMLKDVQARFARREIQKVIMARRSIVPVSPKLKDVTMLMRMRREIPESTRFAFRGLDATFLGATPELLFSKSGSRVCTEALAGSIRTTGTAVERLASQGDALLTSPKDLREHRFVVEQITERLQPFFEKPPTIPPPTTRRIRNIIHLLTPLQGQLRAAVDAVTLLEALHPTPAVGGVPTVEAARCIVEVEPHRRGWYAGPVGWFDQNGDAAFCVAIRSGLLAHPNAYIYAGAGIIAESDPLAEYAETGLKQMPMMLALGVDSVTLRATMAPQSIRPPPPSRNQAP